eukprot:TRINITY_DN1145_c0_g1_i6.p1 TRINITY_DN1145_c0_g1~~TRINITY_DN1145_c0_g1_i6.p1  ORF type:complete len:1092 (-),score=378.88 TRINITY_DN1145_c0_g1_i6:58-3333(-)
MAENAMLRGRSLCQQIGSRTLKAKKSSSNARRLFGLARPDIISGCSATTESSFAVHTFRRASSTGTTEEKPIKDAFEWISQEIKHPKQGRVDRRGGKLEDILGSIQADQDNQKADAMKLLNVLLNEPAGKKGDDPTEEFVEEENEALAFERARKKSIKRLIPDGMTFDQFDGQEETKLPPLDVRPGEYEERDLRYKYANNIPLLKQSLRRRFLRENPTLPEWMVNGRIDFALGRIYEEPIPSKFTDMPKAKLQRQKLDGNYAKRVGDFRTPLPLPADITRSDLDAIFSTYGKVFDTKLFGPPGKAHHASVVMEPNVVNAIWAIGNRLVEQDFTAIDAFTQKRKNSREDSATNIPVNVLTFRLDPIDNTEKNNRADELMAKMNLMNATMDRTNQLKAQFHSQVADNDKESRLENLREGIISYAAEIYAMAEDPDRVDRLIQQGDDIAPIEPEPSPEEIKRTKLGPRNEDLDDTTESEVERSDDDRSGSDDEEEVNVLEYGKKKAPKQKGGEQKQDLGRRTPEENTLEEGPDQDMEDEENATEVSESEPDTEYGQKLEALATWKFEDIYEHLKKEFSDNTSVLKALEEYNREYKYTQTGGPARQADSFSPEFEDDLDYVFRLIWTEVDTEIYLRMVDLARKRTIPACLDQLRKTITWVTPKLSASVQLEIRNSKAISELGIKFAEAELKKIRESQAQEKADDDRSVNLIEALVNSKAKERIARLNESVVYLTKKANPEAAVPASMPDVVWPYKDINPEKLSADDRARYDQLVKEIDQIKSVLPLNPEQPDAAIINMLEREALTTATDMQALEDEVLRFWSESETGVRLSTFLQRNKADGKILEQVVERILNKDVLGVLEYLTATYTKNQQEIESLRKIATSEFDLLPQTPLQAAAVAAKQETEDTSEKWRRPAWAKYRDFMKVLKEFIENEVPENSAKADLRYQARRSPDQVLKQLTMEISPSHPGYTNLQNLKKSFSLVSEALREDYQQQQEIALRGKPFADRQSRAPPKAQSAKSQQNETVSSQWKSFESKVQQFTNQAIKNETARAKLNDSFRARNYLAFFSKLSQSVTEERDIELNCETDKSSRYESRT